MVSAVEHQGGYLCGTVLFCMDGDSVLLTICHCRFC